MPPEQPTPSPQEPDDHESRPGSEPRPAGSLRIGRLAGADILVNRSWFVVAALIAWLSAPLVEEVNPGLGVGKYVVGFLFAVVLYGSVLLHEASHAVVARRMGFHVHSIHLHFLGGATHVASEARTPRQEFWIAVVGPLTSLAVGGLAVALAAVLPDGLVRVLVQGLALANLVVGVTNLVPALPLDGGRLLKAGVWQVTGNVHRGTVVAAWAGRGLAVLVLAWPFVAQVVLGSSPRLTTWLVVLVSAAFLWTSASTFLAHARIRERLPRLVARKLARRAALVPQETPLSEAIARAQVEQAGSIITVDHTGQPVGLVNEAALLATPEERRPWLTVHTVARTLDRSLVLPADIAGEALVLALTRRPAPEYLLVEPDGTLFGVLVVADVDQAFRSSGH